MFNVRNVAIGLVFALAALLAGEMHGMAFGAKEDAIKGYFEATSEANVDALGGPENAVKAKDKAWKYLKRAHEHFMGLGGVALALILLIGLSPAEPLHKKIISTLVGFGAFVYPFGWLMIAVKSASLGAHGAKDAFELVMMAGAGSCFAGLLGTIFITVKWVLRGDEA